MSREDVVRFVGDAIPELLAWIAARLDGEPIPTDELCNWQTPTCCAASPEGTCN